MRVLKTDTIRAQLIAARDRLIDKVAPIQAQIVQLDNAIAAMTVSTDVDDPVQREKVMAAAATGIPSFLRKKEKANDDEE